MHRKVLFWMVVVIVDVVVSSSMGECGNKTTSAPSCGWASAGAELGNDAPQQLSDTLLNNVYCSKFRTQNYKSQVANYN